MDDSGEFEAEDILDSHFVYLGPRLIEEFLTIWHKYDLLDTTWEPLANLENCPIALSSFC